MWFDEIWHQSVLIKFSVKLLAYKLTNTFGKRWVHVLIGNKILHFYAGIDFLHGLIYILFKNEIIYELW